MKAVLDACVLFPTVQRELLLAVADRGLLVPLWSARLLEEWARAAARHGAEVEAQARGQIALLRARYPGAEQPPHPGLERRLWLPDPADIHVLAVAVGASADVIVTVNARDFPRNVLAEEGVSRADPDGLLLGLMRANPGVVMDAARAVLSEANRLSDTPWTARALFKKARLPRIAKAVETAGL